MARKITNKIVFDHIKVLDAGAKGVSVAKAPDGKVIFIPNVVPGDVVDIQTLKKRKAYYEGKAVKFHEFSEHRIEPICEHFGVCGGCKWQHIDYKAQAELKDTWAQDCLQRIGKVEVAETLPIIGAEEQQFYRNKMEYTFSNKRWLYDGENIEDLPHTNALGFHAPGRFDKVLPIVKCWLQDDMGNHIRNFVFDYCIENELSFYDLKEHTGLMRNLMLRNTKAGDWMINVVFAKNEDQNIQKLMQAIHDKFKPKALNYCINEKMNDSTFDQEFINYSGDTDIQEELCGLTFNISPKSIPVVEAM